MFLMKGRTSKSGLCHSVPILEPSSVEVLEQRFPMPHSVLFISPDLMFSSRVTSAVKQLGGSCLIASHLARVLEIIATESLSVVLLDLEAPGLDQIAIIAAAREKQIPVVAYASHVREQLLESARAAGAAEVLPRSRFSGQLDSLLARFLHPHPE